ncbi:MAG: ArsR family transcriptional regulator [Comamonadaceae bacterium]|nr:MAG: ArsR family transcriptional regulator [Comamonadaceae bacterium]
MEPALSDALAGHDSTGRTSRTSPIPLNVAAGFLQAMASPVRLRVIAALRGQEKNVSQLLAEIPSSQPNMSQHLAMLHKAGIVKRRRQGASMYYSIADGDAGDMCLGVCAQIF